jgi:hypothetical protein
MKKLCTIILFLSASLLSAYPGANSSTNIGKEIIYASFDITSSDEWEDSCAMIGKKISYDAKKVFFNESIEAIYSYAQYNPKHGKDLMSRTLSVCIDLGKNDAKTKEILKEVIEKGQGHLKNIDPELPTINKDNKLPKESPSYKTKQ